MSVSKIPVSPLITSSFLSIFQAPIQIAGTVLNFFAMVSSVVTAIVGCRNRNKATRKPILDEQSHPFHSPQLPGLSHDEYRKDRPQTFYDWMHSSTDITCSVKPAQGHVRHGSPGPVKHSRSKDLHTSRTATTILDAECLESIILHKPSSLRQAVLGIASSSVREHSSTVEQNLKTKANGYTGAWP